MRNLSRGKDVWMSRVPAPSLSGTLVSQETLSRTPSNKDLLSDRWEVEVTWGVRSGGLSYQGLKAILLLRQNLSLSGLAHTLHLTARVKTTVKTLWKLGTLPRYTENFPGNSKGFLGCFVHGPRVRNSYFSSTFSALSHFSLAADPAAVFCLFFFFSFLAVVVYIERPQSNRLY